MPEGIIVDDQHLRSLLQDESTEQVALATYFQIDESKPFSPRYELKPEIRVEVDPMTAGLSVGSSILAVANAIVRRKRQRAYRRAVAARPHRTRVVAEGDSWFQHPFVNDVIDHISNHVSVYSLGAAGDELSHMFKENEYIPALEAQGAKCLLLSGGGNDLLGDHFGDYLNMYVSGADVGRLMNREFEKKVSDMMNVYGTLFTRLQQALPSVRVLVHGYDYVIPGTGGEGKWLGWQMDRKGISDPVERRGVTRYIIDLYSEALNVLASGFDNVSFIDARGCVSDLQWYDEIHPDSNGFQQVALRFLNHID
jgi:hypothetical protein